MIFALIMTTLATVWMGAIVLSATMSDIQWMPAWLLVAVVAFVPSILLLHFAKDPLRTASETILEAKR